MDEPPEHGIAVAADDPGVAVAALAGARRACGSMLGHIVLAATIAPLNAGLAMLGFLPPPASLGLAAAAALLPLLRGGRLLRTGDRT